MLFKVSIQIGLCDTNGPHIIAQGQKFKNKSVVASTLCGLVMTCTDKRSIDLLINILTDLNDNDSTDLNDNDSFMYHLDQSALLQ